MTAPASPTTLVPAWLQLWNGSYELAGGLLTDGFRVHAAMLGRDDDLPPGPDALVGWVQQIRAVVPDLSFRIEVGPISQDDMVVVRWRATGHYGGGFPGATSPTGATVDFAGTDVLRAADGRLAEYWVNSDVHVLFAQLGVGAA